jgi:hypothetical protein
VAPEDAATRDEGESDSTDQDAAEGSTHGADRRGARQTRGSPPVTTG